MDNVFERFKKGLIVSCQSEGDDPFNKPELLALFAKAAIMGGAKGIRAQGKDNVSLIKSQVDVPVIGLMKSKFDDGYVRITGSYSEVETLLATGCDIIAIDGTFRKRENLSGPQFIEEVKKRYNCIIMADVATFAEGTACADFGADCISSTLSGYTPDTAVYDKNKPDFHLVQALVRQVKIPVIAEGKINIPKYARDMIDYGAWAVVVGTAISRPRVITSWFKDAIENNFN